MSLSPDTSANKKRTYEEDIEDDMDEYFEDVNTEVTTRRIAKAKGWYRGVTGENMVKAARASVDFEEAGFLAPMDVDDEFA